MARLSEAARAAGYRLVHVAETGSTNQLALEAAAAGDMGPTWFLADRQTAGRGRRGKVWSTEPGNHSASLLISNPGPPAKIAELCFVAALAIDDALLSLIPEAADRLKLKWPNDGLFDGAKMIGILVEATTRGSTSHAVLGIGVNIAHHPGMPGYRSTCLNELGFKVTRDQVFEALTASMVRALSVWNRGEGFAAIRAGWLTRAAWLGEPIVIRQDGQRLEGLFAGVDAEGRLVLATPDGQQAVSVGEASLLNESTVH